MEQYKALDIAKFIFAFLIIGIHVDPVDNEYMRCLYTLAVPYFFAVSSFLFFRRKANFWKYVRRIGQLYLVWFVIEIGVVYSRFFQTVSLETGMLKFFHALVFTNTFWESWYLIASVEAMGLCILLSRWMNNRALLLLGVLLYIPPLLFSAYYGNLPTDMQVSLNELYAIIPITNSFVIAFIFIVIGKMVAENEWSVSFWVTIIYEIIALILWGGEIYRQIPYIYCYKAFFMLPPVVALLLVILKDKRFGSISISATTCKLLRNSSTLIYLSHPLFISLVARLSGLRANPVAYALVAVCSCLFALIIVRASVRLRFLKFFY